MPKRDTHVVIYLENFKKELKKLAKKYPAILEDIQTLINDLKVDPFVGSSLGNGFYKIRLAIPGKNQGKSGGTRVITNIKIHDRVVYLVSIYDKSVKNTVSVKELKEFIKLIS